MSRLWIGLVLWLCAAGCSIQADPPPKSNTASAAETEKPSASNDDEVTASDKKVLDRLLTDAREGIRVKDWTAANRAINEGLHKTEGRRGLEITNAQFVLLRGTAALEQGSEPDARRFFADALAIFHVNKNTQGRFEAFTSLGRLEERRGDYAAAERQFDQAETLRKDVSNRAAVGEYLLAKGRLASRQMKRTEASAFYQEALKIFETAEDKRSMAEALLMIAWEDDQSDRAGAAKRDLERASALFGEIKDTDGKVRAVHRLAVLAERDKQNAKAARLYTEAAELYETLGRRSDASAVERHLSTLSTGEDKSKKK